MQRITSDRMQRTLVTNIQTAQLRALESQEQLSSGHRINRPSDDPVASAQAMGLMAYQDKLEQYQTNINQARAWSVATEDAMNQTLLIAQKVREMVVQGATDSLPDASRKQLGSEMGGLIDSLKMIANSQLNGEYLFSGTTSDQPAYSTATDNYLGNASGIIREVTPGFKLQVNLDGQSVFGDGTAGMIKLLRDITSHLNNGTLADMNNLRNSDLSGMDALIDKLNTLNSQVGETQSRLDFNESRLGDLQTSTGELLSTTRDTDIAKVSAEYAQRQATLIAALKTGQNIVQPSLVDFVK